MSTNGPRPAKRARQACDPCRRKKSRCPGEKPVCSYCERLKQQCVYSQSELAEPESAAEMAKRLESVEDKLEELISSLGPRQELSPVTMDFNLMSHATDTSSLEEQNSLMRAARLYLACCNYQPLPLFSSGEFLENIMSRDTSLICVIQAIALRFDAVSESSDSHLQKLVGRARSLVMNQITNGVLEVSSLQTLCLLALFEFSSGNTTQAGLTISMASYLAQSISTRGQVLNDIQEEPDERLRCLWSIYFLKNLQGDGIQTNMLMAGTRTPFDTGSGISHTYNAPAIPQYPSSSPREDVGMVYYSIQISELWAAAMNYAATRVDHTSPAPWFPHSDYSIITYRHTEFDARVPLRHRYHANRFQSHTLEELDQRRDFWVAWLFLQFVYLTIPCLLNHPFLLSMRLRNFKHIMPQSFLRQSFENITFCTGWVLHLIDLIEHKGFEVYDPIIGHCVVIVATIHLQHSFVEEQELRHKATSGYSKCVRFLQPLSERWPHVKYMTQKLQRLRESIATNPGRQTWSINSRLLWEVLVYDHASRSPASNNIPRNLFSNHDVTQQCSGMMSSDIDFQLLGSAGISGHKTVVKEVADGPPESVSTPPTESANERGTHTTLFMKPSGMMGDMMGEIINENLFVEPENYGRAIEDWWNMPSL